MRLTGSRVYYRPSPPKMPPGLVELMEGLTKEVLKHNPSDVYGFCADHMQQLLEKRDGSSLKKLLTLEQKIARAQGKVRQRAENQRQECYEQSSKATNNAVKEDLILQVAKDDKSILEKGNISLAAMSEQGPQNNVKITIHEEKILEDSGEMVVSYDSASSGSKPKDDVGASRDKKEMLDVYLHESETVDVQISEKSQRVNETESNEPNVNDNINNISLNINPHFENVYKELIDNDISDNSLLNANQHQLNDKQVNKLHNKEEQAEISFHNLETADIEPKKSLTLDCVDNNKRDNGKVENVEDMIGSDQAMVNATVEITDNLSESRKDEQVNFAIVYNYQDCVQLSSNLGDIHDSATPLQTDDNMKQQFTDDLQSPIRVEDIEQSNGATPSQTKEVPELNNTDDLREIKSEISQELILEKNTQQKCDDDVQLFNISNSNDNVSIEQKHTEKQLLQLNDNIENLHTPSIEFPASGVDSDIRTLVTENSMIDTNEINDDAGNDTLQPKSITSVDNILVATEESPNLELISAGNLSNFTKEANKDNVESIEKESDVIVENEAKSGDTSQNKISIYKQENNQNENQGTNLDLETAAITIQKVFRNFLFKSRGSTFEDRSHDEGNFMEEDDKNKEECNFPLTNSLTIDRRAHGITRMDTVLQTVNEEKSLSLSTDDSSTLSSAATVIQAHVRGFLFRNKLDSNKTVSITLAASNSVEPSFTSIEAGSDQNKNKNILNIHIVPEGESCLSRDESLITSMDLSLDSSPPSSINLHPLGYDKSERRKLKREDAIQSISPPSNNSGKLSEDFDSVKELSGHDIVAERVLNDFNEENDKNIHIGNALTATDLKKNDNNKNVSNGDDNAQNLQTNLKIKRQSLTKMNSDEMDVVTPFTSNEDLTSSNLMHSGEFHDAVLPTRVSRSDTSVVRGE